MLTILCWPHPKVRCILSCLRYQFISAGRDPKNLTAAATVENSTLCFNGRNPTDVFPKSLNSQDHLFWVWRHSHSSLISCLGFIITNGDCHILCARAQNCTQWPKALSNWMMKYDKRKMINIKKSFLNYITLNCICKKKYEHWHESKSPVEFIA